ncbi:hypothetical protein COLO4_23959 [Corchorus olitorius]|uniref:Uncharacterized protein n=1 Tax=Corchorus olitorius TaxID=93759 RepID=A0A1R3IDQ2_9ROSI|nr:hypothetical protein COLO4_23959 [Corchorus olitorius]
MAEVHTDSDESTLSRPSSNLTDLDWLMESITPFVSIQYFSEEVVARAASVGDEISLAERLKVG